MSSLGEPARWGSDPSPLPLLWRLLTIILVVVGKIIIHTLRVSVVGPPPPMDRSVLFAFHHGHQMSLLAYPRPKRIATMASLSFDGSIQTRVLTAFDFCVLRGSSSRGAVEGLRALLKVMKDGFDVALAVDGPRGPRGVVKKGAIFLAQRASAAIVPIVSVSSAPFILKRSWDLFEIPMPFSRVIILRGEALTLPSPVKDLDLERSRSLLEERLHQLREEARLLMGRKD